MQQVKQDLNETSLIAEEKKEYFKPMKHVIWQEGQDSGKKEGDLERPVNVLRHEDNRF